jgi:hypothetical protein
MTAPQGRCAGCGKTGPLKPMDAHIARCDDWAAAYRSDPPGTPDAGPEYAQWSAGGRDDERAADLRRRVDDTVRRREESEDRFRRDDILGD